MKKLFLSLLLIPTLSFAEETTDKIRADFEHCTKTQSNFSDCEQKAQERLQNLIQKQKKDLERAQAKVLNWKYEESEDRLRNTKIFSAQKYSKEVLSKKKNGVALLELSSDKYEVKLFLLENKLMCGKYCNIYYKFDNDKIENVSLLQEEEQILIINNPKSVEAFTLNLKQKGSLIVELPTRIGNMQYEFSLEPKLDWKHF